MRHLAHNPVMHLELHTGNLGRACGFYTRLFGWRAQTIRSGSGSYLALEPGDRVGGGVVECDTSRPVWLPYVEVADVRETVDQARLLGASVALELREGPAGWRSVLDVPAGGEIAVWQPKAMKRPVTRNRRRSA